VSWLAPSWGRDPCDHRESIALVFTRLGFLQAMSRYSAYSRLAGPTANFWAGALVCIRDRVLRYSFVSIGSRSLSCVGHSTRLAPSTHVFLANSRRVTRPTTTPLSSVKSLCGTIFRMQLCDLGTPQFRYAETGVAPGVITDRGRIWKLTASIDIRDRPLPR
jgi:hypothetical protein